MARDGGAQRRGSIPGRAEPERPAGAWRRLRRRGVLRGLLASLVAVACAYAAALVALQPPSPGAQITFDDLLRYAVCQAAQSPGAFAAPLTVPGPSSQPYCQNVNRRIDTATFLDEDSRIVGTLLPRQGGQASQFWASYPRSDATTSDLIRTMVAGQSKVVIDPQSGKGIVRFLSQFVLPLVLLANLFALFIYFVQRSGSGGAAEFIRFGRAGSKRVAGEAHRRTTFADIAAADEAVAELAEVRDFLVQPDSFTAMGATPPKGMLLVGPPGCGKTLLGRAVAGEAAAAFFAMSGSEFVESLVGVGAARVRDLFAQARAAAPAIIFIDELDAVGRQRGAGVGQGHDEREQTLNEMLVQMDGFSPSEGLVVLAATNRPDILDPALLRAGRFDRHITVERPAREGRLAILRLHSRGRKLEDADRDLPAIARTTSGFTGADLANLLNEGALLAVREHAGAITREHLDEAVERVVAGPRRRGQLLSDSDKTAVAYHEAGHAVVAAALGQSAAIHKVSIIARGRGVGHLAMLHEDHTIVRRSDLMMQIAIAMAGVAVETLVFGEASTGCEQDVERATQAARDLAGRYGLSARVGPVRVVAPAREIFLGRDYLAARDVSQPTLEQLDSEVRALVEEERDAALEILSSHRSVLDALVRALVADETLQGPRLEHLLEAVRPTLRPASAG